MSDVEFWFESTWGREGSYLPSSRALGIRGRNLRRGVKGVGDGTESGLSAYQRMEGRGRVVRTVVGGVGFGETTEE